MSDELTRVPKLKDLAEETKQSLIDSGFKISNFRTGSVFMTLMMIALAGLVGLYQLVAQVSTQCFLIGAEGIWLDIKAAELGEKRKIATKTEGQITAARALAGSAVKIPKGLVIKTDMGTDGEELRYIVSAEVVMTEEELSVKVPVIAESTGLKYNVSTGMIKNPIKNVPGIDSFTNEVDWLTKEGTDKETDDAFRLRCLAVWDTLATNMTSSAYKVVVSRINGVAVVNVDDEHPRGQATIDVVVTGVAGEPTEELLEEVRTSVEDVRGSYDNVLVLGAQAVEQAVTVTVYKDDAYGDTDTLKTAVEEAIRDLFEINEENDGTRLVRTSIITAARSVKYSKDVDVTVPATNVSVGARQILRPGLVTVNVLNESEAA